jgi:hypothetical protein
MANFPALIPADVLITPGAIPAAVVEGYDGSTVTTAADTMATGDLLTLPFQNLAEAEANGVRNHARDQQCRPFAFDAVTLAPALSLPGYAWVYAADPQQEDIRSVAGSELYFLTCSFRAVRVRLALPPTATSRIVLRAFPARALPAGPPGAISSIRLTPTAAGVVTTPPGDRSFLLLRPTAANVISTPLNDPLYGSVILHLPMTGENNSTAFVDVSETGSTVTPQGNAKISTAQSKWGSGSAYFDGDADWLAVALSSIIGTGYYTIRFWFQSVGVTNNGLFEFANTNGTPSGLRAGLFDQNANGQNRVDIQRNDDSVNESLSTVSDNAWYFFQQTRTSGGVRTSIGTTAGGILSYDPIITSPGRNWTDNFSQGFIDIGLYGGVDGIVYGINGFHGYMNDFQVTKAARPHVVPTGPLPIF